MANVVRKDAYGTLRSYYGVNQLKLTSVEGSPVYFRDESLADSVQTGRSKFKVYGTQIQNEDYDTMFTELDEQYKFNIFCSVSIPVNSTILECRAFCTAAFMDERTSQVDEFVKEFVQGDGETDGTWEIEDVSNDTVITFTANTNLLPITEGCAYSTLYVYVRYR